MNKGFTLAVLGVVLCAMGLVFFLHSGGNETAQTEPTVSGPAESLLADEAAVPGAPSADTALPRLEPPSTVAANDRPSSEAPQTLPAPAGRETPGTAAPADAPRPSVSPVEAPKPEAAKPATPTRETPKAETSAVETPKAEAPKPEAPKPEAPKPEAPEAEAPPTGTPARNGDLSLTATHSLKDIGLHFSGNKILLRITADGDFPAKSFVLSDPERLVVDLPGKWSNMKAPAVPKNLVVKNVRLGNQAAGPRLVLDLAAPLKNRTVRRAGPGTVEILLE